MLAHIRQNKPNNTVTFSITSLLLGPADHCKHWQAYSANLFYPTQCCPNKQWLVMMDNEFVPILFSFHYVPSISCSNYWQIQSFIQLPPCLVTIEFAPPHINVFRRNSLCLEYRWHIASARITGGCRGFPGTTYPRHWHYNSSTCVNPPLLPLNEDRPWKNILFQSLSPSIVLLIRALHIAGCPLCIAVCACPFGSCIYSNP